MLPNSNDLQPFVNGYGLQSGVTLNAWLAELQGVTSNLTAHAGGGKTNALLLDSAINEVVTVTSANDSLKLPIGRVGRQITVVNFGSNSLQVFGSGSDTINEVATATGVAQAAGKTSVYTCTSVTAGVFAWSQMTGA